MRRRTYLRAATVTTAGLVIAGCMGDEETTDPGDADDDHDDDDHDDDHDDDDHDDELEDDEDEEEEDDEYSEVVGTFDDFEDIDRWEGFIGSIEADTSRYSEGSQSALLTPSEDNGQVRVRRELDEPIDVTEVTPGLAVETDLPGTVLIQLQDEDGDYVEFSQQVRSGMPLVRHNFGLTRVRGDPDLSEVTLLQIIRWFGEDQLDAEMWVDDFYFVPTPETGKVMLQFHGGYENHYTEALPILEEYGLTGTTFVPTNRVRPDEQADGDRLTEDQLEALADADWTIGSYSARGLHLDDVEADEVESDVLDPIDWFEENGYEDGARFFAFPGSRYTQESYELVQENYELAFAGASPSQGYAGNPHLCSVTSSPEPDEAADLIDWTADMGGITSIPFFRLDDSESIEALEATAERLSERAEEGDVDVISPGEMADEYVY